MPREKILIITPLKDTRVPLTEVLSDEGYEILTASSGQEGIEILSKSQPDLAIIELAMRDMDGLETLKKFKEIRPETQVIMISGHGTLETAIRAIKMGAFDYLVKPPELQHLCLTIENALKERLNKK